MMIGNALGILAPLFIYAALFVVMLAIGGLRRGDAPTASPRTEAAGFPWVKLTGICAVTAAASLLFYLLQINMARVLVEAGETSPLRNGFMLALVTLGVPLGTWVFSRTSRTPVAVLLLIDFALIALGFTGMSRALSVAILLAFATLNQFGCGLALPTLLTWAMRQFSFAQRSKGIGIGNAYFFGGQFVGVSLLALVETHVTQGRVTPALGHVALIAWTVAAGAAIAVVLRRGMRSSPDRAGGELRQ